MNSQTWDVSVSGREFAVCVLEGEGGKWFVRVDGRAAAKPLGPDEKERIVPVGGALYRLHRSQKNEFALDPHELPAPATVSNHPAALLPDRIRDMPLGPTPTDYIPWSLVVWGGLVAVVALMMWYALGPNYEKQAAGRVKAIVADMAQGTGPEVQFAVGLWARNVRTLADRDELSWASDNFDKWRIEKKLYHRFSSWEVLDSELVEGAGVPTAIVTVMIEGQKYEMRVPERQPISWAN